MVKKPYQKHIDMDRSIMKASFEFVRRLGMDEISCLLGSLMGLKFRGSQHGFVWTDCLAERMEEDELKSLRKEVGSLIMAYADALQISAMEEIEDWDFENDLALDVLVLVNVRDREKEERGTVH